jgi:chemotaxis protein histidine kinase CheA
VTSQLNGTANGHAVPRWDGWQPIHVGGIPAATNQHTPDTQPAAEITTMSEPAFDPVKLAEADRLRALAEAEAKAKLVEAEGQARAAEILAVQEAKAKEIANEQAALRLTRQRAVEEAKIAEAEAKRKAAEAAAAKAAEDAAADAEREEARAREQDRTELWWKWGARGIYAVGLAIAAPVQFIDFWDRKRPFLVAAPALLEGLALVLAFGAAWAVAHRRDVAPYRIGIMLGAAVAATINLRGGLMNPAIGFNAGLIGGIASLGGPIVLMAYEHGIAQKADGIPSWRERRAADKQAAAEKAAREAAKAEREAVAAKAAADRQAAKDAAEAEQKRKDADRQSGHPDVWGVAEQLRSARGLAVVTDALWGEAWLLVTGTAKVGIRPEIEAASRVAHARMKDAADNPASLVTSQTSPREKRDPNAPDGRRFNGGTPPRRTPGDTAPYHRAAGFAASETARQNNAKKDD